jgi:hypothetical protein
VDVKKKGGQLRFSAWIFNNKPITSSILPIPPFPKKKKKENGHQQSPRFNLSCTSRACSLKGCWRFKQKSEAGCFLVCFWILFYVQYTWCTFTHIHSYFQVNNIIRTFHEYRKKVWSLILSVAERNIIKIYCT